MKTASIFFVFVAFSLLISEPVCSSRTNYEFRSLNDQEELSNEKAQLIETLVVTDEREEEEEEWIREKVEEKWIEQRIDNFDPTDERKWKMRYLENSFHFQVGGPIFIYVGGEWTISNETLLYGHMYDMARNLNGTMFYTEHRYYGESQPTPDLYDENGYTFLHVDQALADLAHFIVHIKKKTPELKYSGVILVGCSYSANIVTWFMQLFPYLTSGGWASSAPLVSKVFYPGYMKAVSEVIEYYGGKNCIQRIKEAMKSLERLVKLRKDKKIEKVFMLCCEFDSTNRKEVAALFDIIERTFCLTVQYGLFDIIEAGCDALNNSKKNETLDAFSRWRTNAATRNTINPINYCLDHYQYVDNSFFTKDQEHWKFQECFELGLNINSKTNKHVFWSKLSSSVDDKLKVCRDLWDSL